MIEKIIQEIIKDESDFILKWDGVKRQKVIETLFKFLAKAIQKDYIRRDKIGVDEKEVEFILTGLFKPNKIIYDISGETHTYCLKGSISDVAKALSSADIIKEK